MRRYVVPFYWTCCLIIVFFFIVSDEEVVLCVFLISYSFNNVIPYIPAADFPVPVLYISNGFRFDSLSAMICILFLMIIKGFTISLKRFNPCIQMIADY